MVDTREERRMQMTVLLDERSLDRAEETAEQVEALGARVLQTLEAAGVITAEGDASLLEPLAALPGVIAVEPSRDIDPPDSPTQ